MAKPFRLERFIPSESSEQQVIMDWARLNELRYPDLRWLYASMNGILTSPQFGAQLKRLGRKPGVPDLCLPVARGSFHSLYIELKRKEGGILSDRQVLWIEGMRAEGHFAGVANGASEAIEMLLKYLRLPKTEVLVF